MNTKIARYILLQFAAFASTPLFGAGADIVMWGADSLESAYRWSSTTVGQPWGGGVLPSEIDQAIWKGPANTSSSEGYVLVDTDSKFNLLQVAASGTNKTWNLVFSTGLDGVTKSHTLDMKKIETVFRPLNINFSAAEGNTGKLLMSWASQTMDIYTKTGTGNLQISIGKNITFETAGDLFTINNQADTALAYGAMKVAGLFNVKGRLNVNGSGLATHRDIVIENGGSFTAYKLGTYNSTGFVVNGHMQVTQLIAGGGASNALNIDLGANGLIELVGNASLEGLIVDSNVRIADFRENAIFIKYSDSAKSDVEKYFQTYNGSEWTNSLTLSSEGWVTAAVPEPATYAAVFGALALAFAMARRSRK